MHQIIEEVCLSGSTIKYKEREIVAELLMLTNISKDNKDKVR